MAACRGAPAVKGSSGETSCKWILHLMSTSVSSDWLLSSLVPVDRLRGATGHLVITARWPQPIHTWQALSCVSLPGDSLTVCALVPQVWTCGLESVTFWTQLYIGAISVKNCCFLFFLVWQSSSYFKTISSCFSLWHFYSTLAALSKQWC